MARLSRGHATDNLELLQYLFKLLKSELVFLIVASLYAWMGMHSFLPMPCFIEKNVTDGYDARQRRLLSKGGMLEMEVPVPACLSFSTLDFKTCKYTT